MGAKVANNVSSSIEFGGSLGGYYVYIYMAIHMYIYIYMARYTYIYMCI